MKTVLSVIIPVFNEELRIKNIEKIASYFKKQKYKTEIVIVNDGSHDKTTLLLKKYREFYPLQIISYKKNRGKGYAIKKGMLAAKGTYRLFMDIDLSVPVTETAKFLKHAKNFPVLIASRRVKGTRVVLHQSIMREFMGNFFTKLSQKVLRVPVSDFTCGFKLFNEKVARHLFSRSKIERWGFDSEILFLSFKYKYPVKELPVSWKHNPYTKVKFPQDIFRSFRELLEVKVNDIKKRYN